MSTALNRDNRMVRRRTSLIEAISSRMQGPGGYYNLGNILGLVVALALQIHAAAYAGLTSSVYAFFFGSPAAVVLTCATLVFLASGEIYRAAWADGPPPDRRLNRLGDLASAFGILLLTVSVILVGQMFLAVASGILMAIGKLGSAVTGDDPRKLGTWPEHWPDPLRLIVVLGRLPGLAAAAAGTVQAFGQSGLGLDLVQPATLTICCLLWLTADVMLLWAARNAAAHRLRSGASPKPDQELPQTRSGAGSALIHGRRLQPRTGPRRDGVTPGTGRAPPAKRRRRQSRYPRPRRNPAPARPGRFRTPRRNRAPRH